MMNGKEFDRKRSWTNFKELFQHSSGGTEENDERTQSAYRSAGTRFEPQTSRISSVKSKVNLTVL
jgi:hypothetical protein